ncbi:MAG: formate dehydrogenase subunit alpha [Chloroflexota bacterium]|nr:formate dehydrogenase subunit alpha [Chloroflexota bacterium]
MKEDVGLQPITITLDGREVSGYPGMTILELAKESGVNIPTLCYDPQLTSIGACRVCLVEDERNNALLASCVAPIAPGMIINTLSDRVIERRKTIVKLMLASHPDSCLVCDKGNRCQLRQIASDLGIGLVELQRIPQMAEIEEVNPFLERDLSKCILCAKCIRACQELVVEGAIDYFQRGFTTIPATLNNLPLENSECTFCGTCVALCPTGALTEKEKTYRGTTQTVVQTTCPFCGCGCSICLETKDGHVARVTPGKGSSVNKGTLCVRGSYGCDFIHSPDRLLKPLVKSNGNFKELSWEEALELVGTQFQRIKGEYGGDSLAILGSSKCTNEENYLLQRFARSVLGTNNIDNGGRLYNSASRVGLGSSLGFPGTTNHLSGLEQSELILVIGADPSSSAPAVSYAIKRAVKRQGAKLLLIDPRQTKLSMFAHLWLQPEVGTDVALINGLAKVIIDEGLLDEEFVARRTDNFEAFDESLKKYTLEYVEEATGISGQQIRAAARLYARANQTAIVYGTGITQHMTGTDGVKALANLALLTGNIGRKRGGVYALQRENNGQGACDMGTLPIFLPGYQSVVDAQARRKFEESWGVSSPAESGLTALEIMKQAKRGKIKGMYIVGENPALSFPNSRLIREILASLDFLVVQDMFLTETAKLANVVLPAASFAEKDGTFTNFEGRVQRVQKAIPPLGESLPDWEIILRLADEIGAPMPYSSPQQVMDEIVDTCQLATYSLYEGNGHVESEAQSLYQAESSSHWGVGRIHGGQFPKGFARFCPVEYVPPPKAKKGYPFILLTGGIPNHFGTGSRSSRSARLKKFSPEAFVEICESDARKLDITDGEKVKVISPIGEVTSIAKITDTLRQGMLFMPVSFPATPVNELFDIVLNPETKAPSMKACSVKIEKL